MTKLPKIEMSTSVTVITFTPDVVRDVENVIARELEGVTTHTGARHLMLDFTNVEYLNSVELGTLVGLHKRVLATGGQLTLFNLRPQVFRLFEITRLNTLIAICREG